MKRPRISDAQMDLLAERLSAVGVDRRDFLKVAAGLATLGAAGFNARSASAAPKLAPGEKLAKEQHLRIGGGGWWQNDPSSHDYNKDLYCAGVPALWAGLMKFDVNFQPVPYVASKVTPNADGSVWTFTIRKDSQWSDGGPCTAKDFEWSWKRQMDPASKNPYSSFFYDIKGAEAFNKGKVTDASQVGVRAKDDWTLEVTLEGPRGYFPVLSAYLAALPAHRVPDAPGHEATVRQREGAARRCTRHRPRERGSGRRWLRHPRPLDDPARLPWRGGRQEDPRHPALRSQSGHGPAQGHAVRGRAQLAQDLPDHAGGGLRFQAAGGGRPGGPPRAPQHENRAGSAGAARLPRRALGAQLPVGVDPLVHGLPGPAQRVLRHVLRQEDRGQAPGLGQRRLRQGAGARARHARRQEAPRPLRQGRGDHADRWRLRARRLGRSLGRGQAAGERAREEQARRDRRRRQHLLRHADAHLHHREGLGYRGGGGPWGSRRTSGGLHQPLAPTPATGASCRR